MSETEFGWYLSGLVDGEGTFCFSRAQSQRSLSARFAIGLRADDAAGVRAIASRFAGVGCVRFTPPSPTGKGNAKPVIVWEVHRLGELVSAIVPFFDRFPLQLKKARHFAVWKEAVVMLHGTTSRPWVRRPGRRTGFISRVTAEERATLSELAERLRAGRRFVPTSEMSAA